MASLVPLIVAGLSGLWFTEGFAKIPNHDGTLLRFARDSLLERNGFERSVPRWPPAIGRPTRRALAAFREQPRYQRTLRYNQM